MKELWSRRISSLEAYVPGEQPKDRKYIKLNTNENPYPPSEAAVKAMQACLGDELRLYPDPECSVLVDAISERYGVEKDEVFVGNGSDEVLSMCYPAFFERDETIIFPDITYSFYPVYANLYEIPFNAVPLKENFTFPVEEFLKPNGGIIIANPNAPTGIFLPLENIEKIAAANPGSVVIVDEAYIDFGGATALPLIKKYPNILVVRTTSKSFSLAGLRVGWAMGNKSLISALNTVKNSINSYTLDRIAIAGAAAAIKDEAYFNACCEKVKNTREKTARELIRIGFECLPSSSNFIFAAPLKMEAGEMFKRLREKGILVRYFNKPRINRFLRISIGTDAEMEALCRAAESILGE